MDTPPIQDYAILTIPAGQSREIETPTSGHFFYVTDATHSRFSLQINGGGIFRGKLTRGHSFPSDFRIEKVRVHNESPLGQALDIRFQVGSGTPIDNLFSVTAEDVTPTLRSDTPAIVGEATSTVGVAGAVVDTWIKLLDADDFRSEVWLHTDAAAAAYWCSANPGAASESPARNIRARADTGGFVRLKHAGEVWVRHKEAGKSVYALSFNFA